MYLIMELDASWLSVVASWKTSLRIGTANYIALIVQRNQFIWQFITRKIIIHKKGTEWLHKDIFIRKTGVA